MFVAPALADLNGDGTLEVAQARRDGRLFVWNTESSADPIWSTWGCDIYHSGACVDAALPAVDADVAANSDSQSNGSSGLVWLFAAFGLTLVAASAFGIARRRKKSQT